MRVEDAKVLVTGGGTGIGRAIAAALRARGAGVAVCGRRREPIESAARELGVVAIEADVSDEADVQRMVTEVIRRLGGYDVLINNAAYGYFAPLVDIDRDRFDRLLATNVTGAMLVARESARHFVAQRRGHIVNVASTAGSRGFAGGSAYAASKFALTALTECWRAELRKHDIRVMQINPSEVITDFAAVSGFEQTPSDRKLRAEDIAHAVLGMLEMHDRGFTTSLTVWATNPDS